MTDRQPSRKPPRPLNAARLEELAVAYVGRFATTRAKLGQYLRRKIAEKGWEGSGPAQIEPLVEKLARLKYVDDAAFALAKARSLGQRGYGERRVDMALRQAGVGEQDGAPAKEIATTGATAAAIRYAQRRRIGPFAFEAPDPKGRGRALSAMIRAGHSFDLARRLVDMPPDPEIEIDGLNQSLCR
ncbi:MAG: RecX family transcriptional regulator [Pseudomonadota bacterium]|nr:RecX family transcriptional regulator [Pseudomonadota bacterium]